MNIKKNDFFLNFLKKIKMNIVNLPIEIICIIFKTITDCNDMISIYKLFNRYLIDGMLDSVINILTGSMNINLLLQFKNIIKLTAPIEFSEIDKILLMSKIKCLIITTTIIDYSFINIISKIDNFLTIYSSVKTHNLSKSFIQFKIQTFNYNLTFIIGCKGWVLSYKINTNNFIKLETIRDSYSSIILIDFLKLQSKWIGLSTINCCGLSKTNIIEMINFVKHEPNIKRLIVSNINNKVCLLLNTLVDQITSVSDFSKNFSMNFIFRKNIKDLPFSLIMKYFYFAIRIDQLSELLEKYPNLEKAIVIDIDSKSEKINNKYTPSKNGLDNMKYHDFKNLKTLVIWTTDIKRFDNNKIFKLHHFD